MSEYIIGNDGDESILDLGEFELRFQERERIVRCRDCKNYYEAENYHPSGNYVMRCCKYFDTYNDEVEPDGFCKWGERRSE